MLNDFHINMATIGNSNTKSDEKNMAGFFSIGQQLGKIAVEAGLRYEHVTFKYTENGQLKEDQSKTYNNVFPSLSISTEIGKTQWALSYTSKTQRPSYEDLDGQSPMSIVCSWEVAILIFLLSRFIPWN